jgi:catechol 2,3-dioxygenase-like lactoylglutathione lyase family enzyme
VTPNHLHLRVADVTRARAFYQRWFGLKARCWRGPILLLRSEHGFDLALEPVDRVEVMPAGLHFGFRLDDAAAVRELHQGLISVGYPVQRLNESAHLVWFRVRDPDRYPIEVYWESGAGDEPA